jgi:hypothetical protein
LSDKNYTIHNAGLSPNHRLKKQWLQMLRLILTVMSGSWLDLNPCSLKKVEGSTTESPLLAMDAQVTLKNHYHVGHKEAYIFLYSALVDITLTN